MSRRLQTGSSAAAFRNLSFLPGLVRRFWLLLLLAGMSAPLWARLGRTLTAAEATGAPSSVTNKLAVVNGADSTSGIPQAQAEAAALKQSAVNTAREVAEAYPDEPLGYALLGSAYYNIGRSDEASKYLRKCIDLQPRQAEAFEILARVAYEKSNLEESVRLCEEALKRGQPSTEVLTQLGRALMDLGQTDRATGALRQATQLPDASSKSFYLLGQAYLQAGQPGPAKESFEHAIQLLPDHTQAYFGLFRACLGLGQNAEADRYRAAFQKLEAVDRRSLTDRSAQEDTLSGLPMVRQTVARTVFGAGQVYGAHRELAKAADLFRRAASLDEESPTYRAALEAAYVQRKALAEGIVTFEQLAAEQPKNPLNFLFLGRLRTRLEQIDGAESAYQKVQELAPGWTEGYRALADLYLRTQRKPAEARRLTERLVEMERSGPHYYMLAMACWRTNDRAAAQKAIQQAVNLVPTEKRYRDLLDQLKSAP
ncbi:MAG: tetratricopeptide repeat protein [Verrucomicrobiota bacterium]